MPKKYWKYLPESICIKELATNSAARVAEMVDTDVTDSERVRKISKKVTKVQDKLRKQNQT